MTDKNYLTLVYMALAAAAIVWLVGCTKDPVSVNTTNNPSMKVELLFEYEGCKVYRFQDYVNHYFTNCTQTISTVNCGKNCYREENIGSGK